ncbi:MAG TPA: AI-2E family transporter [Planctomycetota bacterium]|nr:AI-2E family transporter [Planctomycetota bacterium]
MSTVPSSPDPTTPPEPLEGARLPAPPRGTTDSTLLKAVPLSRGGRRPPFLSWLPWEKLLIWALFLLVVYALRHFFFIIFMTFIVTYIMRSVVRRIARTIWPRGEAVWLERSLTVAGFALLLFGLYEGGNYVGPELYRQGEALVRRVTVIEPEKELKNFITKTVGAYLFHRQFGGRSDERYLEKFEEFQAQGPSAVAYTTFPDLVDSLEKRFVLEENERIRQEVKRKLAGRDKELEAWFSREKAPDLFEKDHENLIKEWEKRYKEIALILPEQKPLEDYRKEPNFEAERMAGIHRIMFEGIAEDPKRLEDLRVEWEAHMTRTALSMLQTSPEYERRFPQFYERTRREAAGTPQGRIQYDYAKYLELKDAYKRGEAVFSDALRDVPATEEDRDAQAHAAFELKETKALVGEWFASDAYRRIRDGVSEYARIGIDSIVAWIQRAIGYFVTIPIQLILSLLLSFFISLDMPRLRRGIHSLKQSRVRDFYQEIAPGLYNFGRLIGRAFQAQGVIAVFNTLLTFVAIRLLGIQNEIFLCAIVFFCSFIPVLGVVLSSVPIAIMAIVQPDGSIFLALQSIVAILVIHFIETSVLNPKILGEMLHLHPVMVLAVLAIGEHFFGVWGLLLGVPVTVYIIRCVILNEEIPGLIEQDPLARVAPGGIQVTDHAPSPRKRETEGLGRAGGGAPRDADEPVVVSRE